MEASAAGTGRGERNIVQALLERARMSDLLDRFPAGPIWALFMFVNGFITIAILAVLAMMTGSPFVFPSLGPTAFLFFWTPEQPSACPRNTLIGHAIGIVCGYGSLVVFGLSSAPPALAGGVDLERVLAVALSLASTGALMILTKAAHPPAGATTMIVSLGLVRRPVDLIVVEIAVALLTIQAIVINRSAGLDYPLWARSEPAP